MKTKHQSRNYAHSNGENSSRAHQDQSNYSRNYDNYDDRGNYSNNDYYNSDSDYSQDQGRGYEFSNEYDNGNYRNQYDRGNYRSGYNSEDYSSSYNPDYNNQFSDRGRYNDEYSDPRPSNYNYNPDYHSSSANGYESRYRNDHDGRRYRDTSASQYQGRGFANGRNDHSRNTSRQDERPAQSSRNTREWHSNETSQSGRNGGRGQHAGGYRNTQAYDNTYSQPSYNRNSNREDLYQGKHHSPGYDKPRSGQSRDFSRGNASYGNSSDNGYNGRSGSGPWHGYDATAQGRQSGHASSDWRSEHNRKNRAYYE